mgnify:CR=1 FL=1
MTYTDLLPVVLFVVILYCLETKDKYIYLIDSMFSLNCPCSSLDLDICMSQKANCRLIDEKDRKSVV